jgi:hypothetical protein
MSSRGSVLLLAILGICISQTRFCQAATNLVLLPVFDASGNDSNLDTHWDTIDSSGLDLLAYNGLPTSYNYRVATEFNVSSIPVAATVLSATFHIRYDGSSGSPANTLQFNDYVGNGTVDLSDFEQINQLGPLLNSFGPGNMAGWYDIPVTSFVQSLRSQSQSYLGMMVQNVLQNQTAFHSSRVGPGESPYLSVSFVPEPPCSALAGLAAVFLVSSVAVRRKQQI